MIDRRTFLSLMAFGVAGGCTGGRSNNGLPGRLPERLPLAFSTLGTPDWRWLDVLDRAAAFGYAAIELRTLEGTEDLPGRPEFAPGRLEETRRALAARGLRVASVDSSANLHEREAEKRAAQLAEARRFVDLAAALGAPYVRVFGDRYPEGEPRAHVLERIAAGLREAGTYAATRGVTVLIESHGDFTDSAALLELMRQANSPHVGILWDAHHTFVQSHEAPEDTVRHLGRYIRHTHLKDSVPAGAERRYVLTGTGEVPVREQVEALVRSGYQGLYSFEWEKRWHPEIDDPEVAIPHYAQVMREYLGAAAGRS